MKFLDSTNLFSSINSSEVQKIDWLNSEIIVSVVQMCITRKKTNMGNENSRSEKAIKTVKSEVSQKSDRTESNAIYEKYFAIVSNQQDTISFAQLVENFEQDLAESLWQYFTDQKFTKTEDTEKLSPISKEQFCMKFPALQGTSTDIYVKILQPVHHFIKVCSDAAGASAIQGDQDFIKRLVEKMTSGSSDDQSLSSIYAWRRSECEKFCNSVQSAVVSKFCGQKNIVRDYSSDILTPMQMWYLQCSLPNIFFPLTEKNEIGYWTPLYTSLQHGISTNRFETLVFDYRGPTIAIFRFADRRIVALALDEEWRHSSNKYGNTFTTFLEISPTLKKKDASGSIYSNLKMRSAPLGIFFKDEISIDKEFNKVLDVEVWGCAGAKTLVEQQKLKNWQKQQAERHKKVPLPGNWDDNPDKTLLEMAGFHFSNERKNMELEAKHRQNN